MSQPLKPYQRKERRIRKDGHEQIYTVGQKPEDLTADRQASATAAVKMSGGAAPVMPAPAAQNNHENMHVGTNNADDSLMSRGTSPDQTAIDPRKRGTASDTLAPNIEKWYRWLAGAISLLFMDEEQKARYLEHRKRYNDLIKKLSRMALDDPGRHDLELQVIATGVQIVQDVSGAIIEKGWRVCKEITRALPGQAHLIEQLNRSEDNEEAAAILIRGLLEATSDAASAETQKLPRGETMSADIGINKSSLPKTDLLDSFLNSSQLSDAFDKAFSALDDLLNSPEGAETFYEAAAGFDKMLEEPGS